MHDTPCRPHDACGLSYVGKARDRNEDSFAVDPALGLFLVADGMGGHGHGEVASRLAVDSIAGWMSRVSSLTCSSGGGHAAHSELLRGGVERSHDALREVVRVDPTLRGMGTTVVALWLRDGVAAVAHVGDSRAYRFTAGRLERLTTDHIWVQEEIATGRLDEAQARRHPNAKILTQALGRGAVTVDMTLRAALPGDLYLLCSDGLSSVLGDAEIAACLGAGHEPEPLCRELAARANARGGLDDITVVVVRVGETPGETLC